MATATAEWLAKGYLATPREARGHVRSPVLQLDGQPFTVALWRWGLACDGGTGAAAEAEAEEAGFAALSVRYEGKAAHLHCRVEVRLQRPPDPSASAGSARPADCCFAVGGVVEVGRGSSRSVAWPRVFLRRDLEHPASGVLGPDGSILVTLSGQCQSRDAGGGAGEECGAGLEREEQVHQQYSQRQQQQVKQSAEAVEAESPGLGIPVDVEAALRGMVAGMAWSHTMPAGGRAHHGSSAMLARSAPAAPRRKPQARVQRVPGTMPDGAGMALVRAGHGTASPGSTTCPRPRPAIASPAPTASPPQPTTAPFPLADSRRRHRPVGPFIAGTWCPNLATDLPRIRRSPISLARRAPPRTKSELSRVLRCLDKETADAVQRADAGTPR